MYKLGILSRDWCEYEQRFQSALPSDTELIFARASAPDGAQVEDVDILLADPGILAPHLNHFPNLQWVQSTWAGVAPLIQAGRTDYCLTGIKGVFGAKMREYVFAYLLYFSRNIEAFRQSQQQQLWQPASIDSLTGKQIGIVGVGDIGAEIAKTAKYFGMKVVGLSRSSRNCEEVDSYFDMHNKIGFCHNLDFVVNLLPDTPETHNFIDRDFLSALPKQSVLINAGRGQTIDDRALIDQLSKSQLRAAVLDVFREEPLPASHPYWQMENVMVTQHTAAISDVDDITAVFLANLTKFKLGKNLANPVDWQLGY